MRRTTSYETGFSLIELVVATGVLLAVMAVVFGALNPAQAQFRTQPEVADLTQRLRVAVETVSREVIAAGAGPSQGQGAGPLNSFLAPVLPFREGRRNADPPGSFRMDTITVFRVPLNAVQTTIAQPMPAQSGTVQLSADPGCFTGEPSCGFKPGASVLVFDDTGSYDLFSVTSVGDLSVTLQHNQQDSGKIYSPDVTRIVEVSSRTYSLKRDPATDTFQLVQYDGGGGADVPLADHVVGLSFEYFGDPQPPLMIAPLDDPDGPWTTYGPRAPSAGVQTTLYPAGENCVFVDAGASAPSPRLSVLATDRRLIRLSPADLTDGPWCPDHAAPNRFDADLLRVRAIGIWIRVESVAEAFRGIGPLFVRPGRARDARLLVPDQEVRVEISPPNLNLVR